MEAVGAVFGPVPVLDVLDGDTIVLRSNLGPRTVRLIGIDAPERGGSTGSFEAWADDATRFLRDLIPTGTLVWVELDFEAEDRFGRLLAYVYVRDEAGGWIMRGEPASMVNLMIARAGYADVLTIEPNSLYSDLVEQEVDEAARAGRGIWSMAAGASSSPTTQNSDPQRFSSNTIEIACALYNPRAESDEGAEWVSVRLNERVDTRGYYLWDEGSRTRLSLPLGEHGPGEITIVNPGQGIWNNGGDTIYLKRGNDIIDWWDYTSQRVGEGEIICRD